MNTKALSAIHVQDYDDDLISNPPVSHVRAEIADHLFSLYRAPSYLRSRINSTTSPQHVYYPPSCHHRFAPLCRAEIAHRKGGKLRVVRVRVDHKNVAQLDILVHNVDGVTRDDETQKLDDAHTSHSNPNCCCCCCCCKRTTGRHGGTGSARVCIRALLLFSDDMASNFSFRVVGGSCYSAKVLERSPFI